MATPAAHPPDQGRLVLALMIGGLSGLLNVVFSISLAALIFTGPAAKHLASGIGLALASAVAVALTGALRSRVRPPMYGLQDAPAILLAVSAAAIGRQVAPDALLPTLVALFAAASFGTGLILLTVARLRLGKIARFVPYPVIGGFLAGTGWLLVLGALGVLAGAEVSLSHLGVLLAPGAPARWLPGALLGVALWLLLRRTASPLALPGFIVATTALFYVTLAALGIPVEEAFERGLLMGPFTGANSFPPVTLSELGRVEPGALLGQSGQLAAIAIVTVISTLLNASSFEVATEQEIDLDGELQTTGLANMASGAVGGIPGFLAISSALFGHKLGLRGRTPAITAALVCSLPLFVGMEAFGYAPRAVLGALLLWTGIALLQETVVDTARRLPRGEWLLLLGLLVLVAGWGFLPAIGAGMLIATVLFAVSYGKVGAIRAAATAASLRSRAARTDTETATLDRLGARLHILQLQGYLYFGSAHALLEEARRRFSGPAGARHLVLDFRHVDGLDSSAVQSFQRLRSVARAAGARLVLVDVPAAIERVLARAHLLGPGDAGDPLIRVLRDLDHGIERCEDELLAASATDPVDELAAARESTRRREIQDMLAAIAGHAERIEVEPGEDVYRQGDAGDDLLVIERGELSAYKDVDGRETRLRAMGPGSIVGEVALYLHQARSGTVRATRPSVLHRLTRAELARIEQCSPERAAQVHRTIATALADRLARATGSAQAWFR